MMLQSLKLHADKLSDISETATTAAVAAPTAGAAEEIVEVGNGETATQIDTNTTATTMLTTAPVAHVANGMANGSSLYNGNSNTNTLNSNNNNNLEQQQLQLQQPEKYLENLTPATGAIATATTFTGAAKSFHPYMRPSSNIPAAAATVAPTTTMTQTVSGGVSVGVGIGVGGGVGVGMSTTLFETLLHNQINSNATTAATVAPVVPIVTATATTIAAAATTEPTTAIATAAAAATTAATAAAAAPTPLINSSINSRTSLADQSASGAPNCNPDAVENQLVLVPIKTELVEANAMDTGDSDLAKNEPDADNIKMFVGQIPKTWDETKLRRLFEQFGRVHTLNVLRDKVTSISRGCCFVTYYTRKAALRAQDALHNLKTLDGMHHPIQMKPADSENRNERKLFVGMLNKKYTEPDVRQLFAGHGTIEECTVLRDQVGQSKGCAFVTFATKQNAIGAIKSLHQSQTMDGCSAPLVVKFADTQKEKDQKKMQQFQTICGIGTLTQTPSGGTAAVSATPTANAATALIAAAPTGARTNPSMAAALAGVQPVQGAGAGGHTATLVQVPTSAALSAQLAPTLLTSNSLHGQSPGAAAAAAAAYLTGDPTGGLGPASAAHLQLYQQMQAYGIHPAHYLQGLNFHPPDNSAHLSQHGPSSGSVGSTAATLSAANAASAAAALAGAAPPSSLPLGVAPSASTSGYSGGLTATGHAPGTGLLANASVSMQNLVALLNTPQRTSSSTTSLSHSHRMHNSSSLSLSHSNSSQQHLANSNTHNTSSSHNNNNNSHQRQLVSSYAPNPGQLVTHAQHSLSLAQLMGVAPPPPTAAANQTLTLSALWPASAADPYGTPALSGLTSGATSAAAYGAAQPLTASALQAAAAGVAGKQIEGPDGSNLFIYHLPQEFIDTDLASTFLPFGNVLSAKVFIDKQTNLSKCFGFVSYDNPHSANAAIQAMHGFQIGTKRLKVQLKRSRDAAKPY